MTPQAKPPLRPIHAESVSERLAANEEKECDCGQVGRHDCLWQYFDAIRREGGNMNQTLLKNLVGTAYNVLLERGHPDVKEFEAVLKELPSGQGSAFDLRFWTADGKTRVK